MIVDDYLKDPLLRLIAVVDQCNHAVKQGELASIRSGHILSYEGRVDGKTLQESAKGCGGQIDSGSVSEALQIL